jgi:hypothetical protein
MIVDNQSKRINPEHSFMAGVVMISMDSMQTEGALADAR